MKKHIFSYLKYPLPLLNKQTAVYYSMLDKLPSIKVEPEPLVIEDKPHTEQKLNRAMKHYLDKVTAYKKFMDEERSEFEIGKRHLANMMGRDPETFTQKDIDESIEYLFPCGLYQPKARPVMKPPEEIYPANKEAAFDTAGRPYHPFFYTLNPNFYQILHDAVKVLKTLNELEDRIVRGEDNGEPYHPLDMAACRWLDQDELSKKLNEKIDNKLYEKFISMMKVIVEHPYSSKVEDFVGGYTSPLEQSIASLKLQEPVFLEDGRKKVTYDSIPRKTSLVGVTAYYPGTGKFSIEGKDIHYFSEIQAKETVLFPLIFSKLINKVDIEAKVIKKSGEMAVAGGIRYGISLCLANFVDDEMREKMRLAGLLQIDYRTRERKKAGQWGARRKFTWKKR